MEEYTGTSKPKDYSSYVKIKDSQGDTLQQGRIWMNNPMRFRGETFYQSGYMNGSMNPYGVEQTTLQVVTNAGWLIPYVACVLSGLGMLVHFGGTFARFASRYDRLRLATGEMSAKLMDAKGLVGIGKGNLISIILPIVACSLVGVWISRSAKYSRRQTLIKSIGMPSGKYQFSMADESNRSLLQPEKCLRFCPTRSLH